RLPRHRRFQRRYGWPGARLLHRCDQRMKGSRVSAMPDQEIKFRYYSPCEGRAVARFGTPLHIGATRTALGYQIDPEAVVAIPETEFIQFSKDYTDAVRNGDLKESNKEAFDAYQQKRVREMAPAEEPEEEPQASAQPEEATDVPDDRHVTPEDIAP